MTDTSFEQLAPDELALDSQKSLDAIELLIQDHRRFEELFLEYAGASTFHKKLRIAKHICDELTWHAKLEESLFYPAARNALGSGDSWLAKARVEHAAQKWLIAQVRFDTPASPLFDAKMDVLRDYVLQHTLEEEVEIFPRLQESDINSIDLISDWVAARVHLQKHTIVH